MNPLFTILFEDLTKFNGGDYENTKWKDIPNKVIRSLFYSLPSGDYLALGKCDKYYHIVEVAMDLTGENKGKKVIEYCYIMGKKEDKITIYKIDMKRNQIEIKVLNENDKWIKSLNPDGWR